MTASRRADPVAIISLPDGREYSCRVIDMSLSGAALQTEARPPIGSPVNLGKIRATVVRHFEEGVAVEYAILQTAASIEQNLALIRRRARVSAKAAFRRPFHFRVNEEVTPMLTICFKYCIHLNRSS